MYASRKSTDGSINMDIEYSPSRNCTRFQEYENPANKVLENFIEVTRRETERVRSIYQTRLNVHYGKNGIDNQLLDIYYKEVEQDSPIFVFIHGGYWQELDKNTSGSFVAPLVERGHRVLVVDYNLCPNVTLEQQMEQTLDLFEWIFNYADATNASSISFCGHSAGSHLAALLFNSEELIKLPAAARTRSFFLMGGVYDLRELWNMTCTNPDNILSLDCEKATELSPILWDFSDNVIEFYKQHNVKIFVIVGEFESSTFIGQSRKFCEILKRFGFEAEYKKFAGNDHFDLLEDAALEESPISQYVLKNIC